MSNFMPNNDAILSLYKTVAQITEQMLYAAQIGDWDQLVVLESRCSAHVGELMQQEPLGLPSAVGRAAKVRFIQKILDADRQIRDLVHPWMVQLGAIINSNGTQRKLVQAYGSPAS
jgi:flagellar protein FliT